MRRDLVVLGSRWPVPPSARPRAGAVSSAHSLILSTSSWVSRSFVRSYSFVVLRALMAWNVWQPLGAGSPSENRRRELNKWAIWMGVSE